MNKIGVSLSHVYQNREIYEKCKRDGVDCIEISTCSIPNVDVVNFAECKKLSEEFSLELNSYHIPFDPFESIDISSKNAELRQNSVAFSAECIKKAADIGIGIFVIHPSAEPIGDEEREERIKCSQESLAFLAQVAAKCGGVIAVEDLPRTCLGRDSSDILKLLSADDRLRVCFDTNHLLKEDCVDFIKNVGNKIITTHVSDFDFINERHWLPGEGKVNWNELYSALKAVNYTGAWLYELALYPPKTIERPRNLTYEDLVRNAKEIFSGAEITVIGKAKENLGMWG